MRTKRGWVIFDWTGSGWYLARNDDIYPGPYWIEGEAEKAIETFAQSETRFALQAPNALCKTLDDAERRFGNPIRNRYKVLQISFPRPNDID